MLEKLQARRELLAKEHAGLIEQHGELSKDLKETEQKLTMLVGHVGELDYQIKELQTEIEDGKVDDESPSKLTEE
tara:strand:+ start:12543 stop:12767 length:225 start_codon:yes stop_codon:yes gene_type:complete